MNSKEYTIYKCLDCNKTFILLTSELKYNEKESKYISCPYHGRHKRIIVTGSYDSIKEIMESADKFKKVKGKFKSL